MSESYKTTQINNRRYLGNKYRLLPFIRQVVEQHCHDVQVAADLFAGTGAVASAFQEKTVITNDILYSNYVCNYAWFGAQDYGEAKIASCVVAYNRQHVAADNYMSDNFADTFFSRDDSRKIGYVREDIEWRYRRGLLNERERALLITSLLYAMARQRCRTGL